ncbi:hypothetical protein ACP4OV_026056 [Aristida adscensionis]
MASPEELNCLKRKLVDDCLSKDCKSRRIETEDGPSSSSKGCSCRCTRPNLANDCVNYLKSGVPIHIMYYKQGSWINFPEHIMRSLIEEFGGNKSGAVAVMDDEPVLVDFLSMTLVNLKTRKQQSVAWLDDTGKCFLPSLFFDEVSGEVSNRNAGNIEGGVPGVILDKVASAPPEQVKQVVLESSSPVDQKPITIDMLRKKITSVERGSKDFLFVRDLFLSGMGPFATSNSILHVHRYSPKDIAAQCRFKAFERQLRSTKEAHGDANVRYGWLGSKKNDIIRILINGLDSTAKPVEKAGLSAGVFLSPENRTFTSVGLCDVDEKGVQYMLLCQVILGNMEAVKPGSQESFPSSKIYDSGVDDCSNPKCYVMWPSHLSTHMRLEYLVSFKLAPKVRDYLLGLKGLWFHPSPKEVPVDVSALEPYSAHQIRPISTQGMCEADQGPTTPWVSLKVLFGVIQDNLSSIAMELLFHHLKELEEKIITREEMVKKMQLIVGEKILLETLKEFQCPPSLWVKSSVEALPSDPASAAVEKLTLDKTGANRSLTLSGNHGHSHAPDAVTEHLHPPALITKPCGTLAPEMVPKDQNCVASSGVPQTSNSAAIAFQDSPGVEPDHRNSLIETMSPGNCATLSAKNRESFVLRMPPIVRDGLLRTSSGRSAFTGFVRKRCESSVPALALGNSESTGAKCLNSAPKMTSEVQEFLSLGIASQRPAHSARSQERLSSATTPHVDVPGGNWGGNSSSVSTGGCDPLPLTIKQECQDQPTPSQEPKNNETPPVDTKPENDRNQAQDEAVTKVSNAPTPVTEEPKDQAALRGSQNKPPGPDASTSHVGAAVALVALSMPREEGGR